MSGSYGHVIQKDGNLRSNVAIAEIIETGGDAFETIEEMYGMIWWLIGANVRWSGREKQMVVEARRNYKDGLQVAKQVNEEVNG